MGPATAGDSPRSRCPDGRSGGRPGGECNAAGGGNSRRPYMATTTNRSSSPIYPSSQYPLDLQWVLYHLSPGAALAVVLLFEGVKPGQVLLVDWSHLDHWGRVLTVGSTVIHLSRTSRAALGPRGHRTGPVVTRWDGTPITRHRLLKHLKDACLAAGVGPWTARDVYQMGIRHRATRATWSYTAVSNHISTSGYPPAARTPYRSLGMGILREGHGGRDIALQVRHVRPGLRETAEEWVDRAHQIRRADVDRSIESRAECYATAAGLSSHPTTRKWTETLVQVAAMWTIDDVLPEHAAEVFATLVRDGSQLDEAAELAQLLMAHDHG